MKNGEKSLFVILFAFMPHNIAAKTIQPIKDINNNSQLFVNENTTLENKINNNIKIEEVENLTEMLIIKNRADDKINMRNNILCIGNAIVSILIGLYWLNNEEKIFPLLPTGILEKEKYDNYAYFWFGISCTYVMYPMMRHSISLPLLYIFHFFLTIWAIKDFEIEIIPKLIMFYFHFGISTIFLCNFVKTHKRQSLLNLAKDNKELQLQIQEII